MTGEQITRKQMADLLTVAAQYDGRTLVPETFEAWYRLLSDLPAGDIEDAIVVHYRESTKWIMPAHIVEHCQKRAAARAIEVVRQSPPSCASCGVGYALSPRPGSVYALPRDAHTAGCREITGPGGSVLVFNEHGPSWGVMPVGDPGGFDEVALEAAQAAVAAKMASYRAAVEADPEYGPREVGGVGVHRDHPDYQAGWAP